MKKFILSTLVFLPSLTFAQQLRDINSVAQKAVYIGNLAVALIIAFAVIWLIFTIIQYFVITDDADKRKEGGMRVLYGVIGLFLTMSIWGLVGILSSSFVFQNRARPNLDIENIKIPNPVTGQKSTQSPQGQIFGNPNDSSGGCTQDGC